MKLTKSIHHTFLAGILGGILCLEILSTILLIKISCGILIIILFYAWEYLQEKTEYNNKKQFEEDIISELINTFNQKEELIVYKNEKLEIQNCSNAFVQLSGFKSKNELLNKSDFDIFNYEIASQMQADDLTVLKNKKLSFWKQQFNKAGGIENVFEILKLPIISNKRCLGLLYVGTKITKEKKDLQPINEDQKYLSAIIDNLPFLAYLKDNTGKYIFGSKKLNEKAELYKTQYNIDLKEVLKINKSTLSEEDKNIFLIKKTKTHELKIKTPEKDIWLLIQQIPLFDTHNEIKSILEVVKEITCEKEIQAQKETFIATLTHDLKTPTAAQIRALTLLSRESFGELSNPQKEIINQTLNSCKYMFNMISTILSTYKTDSCENNLNYEWFNFKELILECKQETAYLCSDKVKILCTSDIENEHAYADKVELKRVVTNLISNAIIHSDKGYNIQIVIEENKNEHIFKVLNKSQYIPQEEIEKLFDKYISKSLKYSQTGTGLGLYLSKKIIEKHKGKMIATSQKENGNTFGFSIPKKKDKGIIQKSNINIDKQEKQDKINNSY